jgi:sulfur carrier protein
MTGQQLTITVNGTPHDVDAGTTIGAVTQSLTPQAAASRGMAVAVNDAVVPRGAWHSTTLAAGDRVEILTAVPGG